MHLPERPRAFIVSLLLPPAYGRDLKWGVYTLDRDYVLGVEVRANKRRWRAQIRRNQGKESGVSQTRKHRPGWSHYLAQSLLLLVAAVVILALVQISFVLTLPLAYLVYAALLLLSIPPFYLLWRTPPEKDSLRWQLWGPFAFILPMVSVFLTVYDLVWKTNQTPVYGWLGFLGFVIQTAASFVLWISLLVAQMKVLSARRARLQHERQPLEYHLWGAGAFLKDRE
jgi:hypothetical protein